MVFLCKTTIYFDKVQLSLEVFLFNLQYTIHNSQFLGLKGQEEQFRKGRIMI